MSEQQAVTLEAVETLAGIGADEAEAALILGLTVEAFEQLTAAGPLAQAWEAGKAKADAAVAQALYANALAGNIQAQQFWLCNRQPDRWTTGAKSKRQAQRRLEHQENPLHGLRVKRA